MDHNHIINVGNKGTFSPAGNIWSTSATVDALVEKIVAEKHPELTLYFHGGLVNEESGYNGALLMNEELKAAGTYPISFVWETGVVRTIYERLFTIRKTKLFKKLLEKVLKRVGSKMGIELNSKGIGQLSPREMEMILNGEEMKLTFAPDSEQNRSAVVNSIGDEEQFQDLLKAEFHRDLEEDEEFKQMILELDVEESEIDADAIEVENQEENKGINWIKFIEALVQVAFRVIKRMIQKRNHGIYPTIFEEILRQWYVANAGAWLWDGMKQKAGEMWFPNEGKSGDDLYAGTYFLTRLSQALGEQNIKLNMIGHSAGSIAICHLLKSLRENYSNLEANKIILMAPACRGDLFHEEIVKHQKDFASLRMFTMTDEAEFSDPLIDKIPFVYPASLLYLVSGILEDEGKTPNVPIAGMERFINWGYYHGENYLKENSDFLNEENRLILSPTMGNAPGFNSTAIDHGAFNENRPTLDSIIAILKGDDAS